MECLCVWTQPVWACQYWEQQSVQLIDHWWRESYLEANGMSCLSAAHRNPFSSRTWSEPRNAFQTDKETHDLNTYFISHPNSFPQQDTFTMVICSHKYPLWMESCCCLMTHTWLMHGCTLHLLSMHVKFSVCLKNEWIFSTFILGDVLEMKTIVFSYCSTPG